RRTPVAALILERLPSTVELAVASMLLAATLGLGLGLLAALKRNTPIDGLVMLISLGGVSMPSFWLSMLLILVFSVLLGLLPATGSGGLDRLILPAIALGYEGVALIARLTRASMLEVLGRPYITTARAKGLHPRGVALVGAAFLVPLIVTIDPYYQRLNESLLPPGSPAHPLGTDHLGRDVLLRLIDGARVSLTMGFIAVAISVVFGTVVGLVAGYFG